MMHTKEIKAAPDLTLSHAVDALDSIVLRSQEIIAMVDLMADAEDLDEYIKTAFRGVSGVLGGIHRDASNHALRFYEEQRRQAGHAPLGVEERRKLYPAAR